MALTFRNYLADQVDAARSVCWNLFTCWANTATTLSWSVVWFRCSSCQPDSSDMSAASVDLALNHRTLRDAGYATIQALLLRRGYEQDPRQPFIFHRKVVVKGNSIKVEVDFLSFQYRGTAQ